jgi:hypothetical protein
MGLPIVVSNVGRAAEMVLRRRPVSTNLEPFNLSTALIAVHKDCYTALGLTRQGGRHRRETVSYALTILQQTIGFSSDW